MIFRLADRQLCVPTTYLVRIINNIINNGIIFKWYDFQVSRSIVINLARSGFYVQIGLAAKPKGTCLLVASPVSVWSTFGCAQQRPGVDAHSDSVSIMNSVHTCI